MKAKFHVMEETGAYREAGEPEILRAAADILEKPLLRGDVFESPDTVRAYLSTRIGRLEYEVFAVMFLTARHSLIACEEMFRGSLTGTAVYPREVVKRALMLNAAAVVFSHNHPSGNPEPSRADETLTQRLVEALSVVDVRVLDHIIIGDGATTSFSERGLL